MFQYKKVFPLIYLYVLCLISVIFVYLLIAGSINREGYLSEFILENSSDIIIEQKAMSANEKVYIYHFKLKYHSKIFKNSDIFGVYPHTNNLEGYPKYIESIKWDGGGSPFGTIRSMKKIEYYERIDNIKYNLQLKRHIFLYYALLVVLYVFIYFIKTRNCKLQMDIKFIFCLIMTILFFIFAYKLIFDGGGFQLNIFFGRGGDFFADFFNVIRYIALRNPYFNEINGYGEKAYLPISYLILYPFSKLANYSNMNLLEIWASITCLLSAIIFITFCILLFFLSLQKIDTTDRFSIWILAVLFLSGININSIERGNLIILTAFFISIYIAYYDSENKSKRIIAIIALAFSVSLKVYPIILGFLLLYKKRYRDIIAASIITLLLVFLPFLFFEHGFYNIPKLIENVKLNTGIYGVYAPYRFGFSHLSYITASYFNFGSEVTALFIQFSKIMTLLLAVISILYAGFENNNWKKIFLLISVIVQLPLNSGLYCGLYYFPVIILFFNRKKYTNIDLLFVVLFSILLNPIQIISQSNYIIINIVSIIMWMIILVEAIYTYTPSIINRIKIFTGKIFMWVCYFS